uniref:Uncharacterized protein n=2 Tax=Rhizophora mucronata TaxID=61149 RepID=A0A2P2JLW6_RHIMU
MNSSEMAVAAFKSTTSRSATATAATTTPASSDRETKDNPTTPRKKPPPRRSRSVSAVSRFNHVDTSKPSPPTATTTSSSSCDFLIKRDNPLYWTTRSIEKDSDFAGFATSGPGEEDPTAKKIAPTKPNSPNSDRQRGRSTSRSETAVNNASSGIGRADAGRRSRSVSRRPFSRGYHGNSESDVEEGVTLLNECRNRKWSSRNTASDGERKSNLLGRSSGLFDDTKSLRSQTDGSATHLPSSPSLSFKDEVLEASLSEAEITTVQAFCEQMKSYQGEDLSNDTSNLIYETVRSEMRRAITDIRDDLEIAIQRSNAVPLTSTNVADIPPDLVNTSAVELVSNIRRDYANKLGQSRERARRLRADLAVEEHRGLELSRILKEVLPDPKNLNVQKFRQGRRSSIEKRRMSRQLTEEALAYFDEVSLSTFDSSDLSSQEDPPPPFNLAAIHVGDPSPLSPAGSSIVGNHCSSSCLYDERDLVGMNSYDAPRLSVTSFKEATSDEASLNTSKSQLDRSCQFSFAHKSHGPFDYQQDIKHYIKNCEKDNERVDIDEQIVRSKYYDSEEHRMQASQQKLLFDRVFFRNRVESGSMLLCGGGLPTSLSPFAS